MRKKKNNVYVGLDGLDIKVNTTKVLEQNYYIFYNKNNDEIGHLQAVKDGYLLHLCLPKVLRNDNTIPFCKEDFKHIENVLACVQTQLESLFGNAIYVHFLQQSTLLYHWKPIYCFLFLPLSFYSK